MRTFGIIALLVVAHALAFAQLEDNTITVTASSNLNVQPDQVVFNVVVSAPPAATLDDVLGVLKGTGITSANLVGNQNAAYAVASADFIVPSNWTFSLTLPYSKLNSEITALNAVQETLPRNGVRTSVTYTANSNISSDLLESQVCPYDSLLADARNQAKILAAAAQVGLGGIVSVNSSGQSQIGVPTLVGSPAIIYDPISSLTTINTIPVLRLGAFVGPSSYMPTCTLSVQFRLLH
jgi:hypothetical protein